MKKTSLLTFALALVLASCGKDDKNDPTDPKDPGSNQLELKLTTNSPVNFGEELKVEVQDKKASYTYETTLPAQRGTFSQAGYLASEARFYDQGWYKVSVSDGNGQSITDSVYAKVKPASFSCSPESNKMTSNLGNLRMSFSTITHKANGSFGYEVLASTQSDNLRFNFKQKAKPGEAKTFISKESGTMAEDEVSISVTLSNGSMGMVGKTGQQVHVSIENGKTVITLCDFEVHSSATGAAKVSTKIILD